MVESLRRLLWLAPLVVSSAALLFCLLATTIAPPVTARPLFFNAAPTHAENEAREALADFATAHPAKEQRGEKRLRVLGGAGLPHILPRLSTLPVRQRRMVANALWPVAGRMNLADEGELSGLLAVNAHHGDPDTLADARLVFWERVRAAHSLDFREVSVHRLVRRLAATELKLRRADLLVVDTFALPVLIEELGRVRVPADVRRVERLAEIISHVTERRFRVPRQASLEEAQRVASEMRLFWDERGAIWSQMGRVQILAASVGQTEFAYWIRRSFRRLAGIDQRPLGHGLWQRVTVSAPLFALCLVGALLIAPGIAAAAQIMQMQTGSGWRRPFTTRLGIAACFCIAIAAGLHAPPHPWLLACWCLLGAATVSAYLLHREITDRFDWRSRQVLARRKTLSRVQAIARWLAPSIPTMAPLAVAESAVWVTCLELGSGAPGLGAATFAAVQRGDLDWLMFTCLALGLLTWFMQLISDAFLGTTRVRWRET